MGRLNMDRAQVDWTWKNRSVGRQFIEHTLLTADVMVAAADEGKCYDNAMKEVKLPKYESWGNYATWLPGNVERYCLLRENAAR